MPSYLDPILRMNAARRAAATAPPVPTPVDPGALSLLGGTDPSGVSGTQGYRDMSPADFARAAQDHANAGLVGRNIGPAVMGLGSPIPGAGLAMKSLDNSMFNNELQTRSAAFTGLGQPMPDEFMAAMLAGGEAPGGPTGGGVNAADLGAAMAEQGFFAKGGEILPEDLFGPDPPGPDQGFIGAKAGERVLNETQFAKLSPKARAEVERLMKERRRK